jgi:hypothetical protein
MLRQVPVFAHFSSAFVRELVTKLRPVVCTAGDWIVNFGEEIRALHLGESVCVLWGLRRRCRYIARPALRPARV